MYTNEFHTRTKTLSFGSNQRESEREKWQTKNVAELQRRQGVRIVDDAAWSMNMVLQEDSSVICAKFSYYKEMSLVDSFV